MVFTFHFTRGNLFTGAWDSVPVPVYPLSILVEGHTGVALFMVLSGYLFAKLLGGKTINYRYFIWNRFLRLAPLLLLVIAIVVYQKYQLGRNMGDYLIHLLSGVWKPALPNGGWSITIEFHFYLLLPFLLFINSRWKYSLMLALLAAIITRFVLYQELENIRDLSYRTIIGRIDQFLLGMMAFRLREQIAKKHIFVIASLAGFLAFYSYFALIGGFGKAPASMWVYLPTIEGAIYALMIAWYDNSFKHSTGRVSRFIALIGQYSYSIYLLHFFFVFGAFTFISNNIYPLSNIYINLIFSSICFLLMVPIAYLSYTFFEMPFLRFRIKYVQQKDVRGL